jgi:hypothetical protein
MGDISMKGRDFLSCHIIPAVPLLGQLVGFPVLFSFSIWVFFFVFFNFYLDKSAGNRGEKKTIPWTELKLYEQLWRAV